ncbi:MAG: hypothetical protein JWL69_4130 [Phycisphaerales bacterium]|jgi:hypothetical protein|nr:hypothetical protein [Phycisphaerales bacterium]MDB5354162.1 hypothetical protein [Phycisphaerales bacterium]
MQAGFKPLMPLNRDWMDVARYLDGGIHPAQRSMGHDRLVAACELQRLRLLAWTSALRGANTAAQTAQVRARHGVSEVRAAMKKSADLHAMIAQRRCAARERRLAVRRAPDVIAIT